MPLRLGGAPGGGSGGAVQVREFVQNAPLASVAALTSAFAPADSTGKFADVINSGTPAEDGRYRSDGADWVLINAGGTSGGGGGGGGLPQGFINNFVLSQFSNNEVTVQAGECIDSTNTDPITRAAAGGIRIDGGTGQGFLDTGTRAANTLYHAYVIGHPSGSPASQLIASLSSTGPALPSGFTIFRRVGSFRTDGGLRVMDFAQVGEGRERWFHYGDIQPIPGSLSGGNATSLTSVTIIGGAANGCPTTAKEVLLSRIFTNTDDPGGADRFGEITYSLAEGTSFKRLGSNNPNSIESDVVRVPLTGTFVQYRVSNSNSNFILRIVGYLDIV